MVLGEPGHTPPVLLDVAREPEQAVPPVLYLMLLENQDTAPPTTLSDVTI